MSRFHLRRRHAARPPLPAWHRFAGAACTTLAVLAAVVPSVSNAQSEKPREALASRADPLNAEASVPAVRHESAFTQYRRLSDVPVGSWRDANDTVGRIGGWRTYAREAGTTEPAPTAPPAGAAGTPNAMPAQPASRAEPAKAMPPGHDGHKMK